MKFSVLISVYAKENPDFLRQALASIWDSQKLKPDEIVLVKDGPLNRGLDDVIMQYSNRSPLRVISLKENVGLGEALKEGLLSCTNDLVARMDSDDISHPDRFLTQVEFMTNNPGIAILGSNIAEFSESIANIISYREVPYDYISIANYAKKRCPFNHMTVIFRKTAILEAGNYIAFRLYEDYHLWARILLSGNKAQNLPEILVYARVGNAMLKRRKGFPLMVQEYKLQKYFRNIQFISATRFLINMFVRVLPRILPIWILKIIYKFLRSPNVENNTNF